VTDQELNRFEAELRRTRPASPPEDFWSRLLAAARPTKASPLALKPAPVALGLQRVLRFLIPATGLALASILAWRGTLQPGKSAGIPKATSPPPVAVPSFTSTPPLNRDEVQIDQNLISSFDTLAKLPSGEPVRLQCREWMDKVTLSDKTRGLVLEERTPRVEIVLLGSETY